MKTKFLLVLLLICLPIALIAQDEQPDTIRFTTDDGSFSFDYPAGWFVEVVDPEFATSTYISIYNLPDDQRDDSPEAITIRMSLPRKYYDFGFDMMLFGIFQGETPAEMVASIVPNTSNPEDIVFATPSADGTPQPLQFQNSTADIMEFTVNRRPAAYGYSANTNQFQSVDTNRLIVVADVGGDYRVSAVAGSAAGGLATIQQNEVAILHIVESILYSPPATVFSGNPELPQVYSGPVGLFQSGNVEFYYPEDWYISSSIGLGLSNVPRSLVNSTPASGEFFAVIQGVGETVMSVDPTSTFNLCDPESSDETEQWTARELVTELLSSITPAQAQQLENGNITISQPEIVTVEGVEIVYIRQYQNDLEVVAMYIDLGEGNVMSMSAIAHQGELSQYEDQLFAIVGTFQYTPLPCDE